MNIVLISSDELNDRSEIRISADDPRAEHIRSVLRLEGGSWLRAGIVNGSPGSAEIRSDPGSVTGEDLILRFLPDLTRKPELFPRVDLILGSVRPIQLKRIFRDLASIGVSHTVVAAADLSEASYFHSNIWKTARLRQLLIEGASQGGHTALPEVTRCPCVDDAVAAFRSQYDSVGEEAVVKLRLEQGAPAASAVLNGAAPKRVLLAIGPERGFTQRENSLLDGAGFESLGIPSGILRTETAATAAVCVVRSWTIGP